MNTFNLARTKNRPIKMPDTTSLEMRRNLYENISDSILGQRKYL
jgi:hypothetical protein